jgi:glycosyltransferase involved in cell wall biosynthesis
MIILFIHQNFPGQFKHLAPVLAKQGHEVWALTMQENIANDWNGVRVIKYKALRSSSKNIHPWLVDFETKVIRGESVYKTALKMKQGDFYPDVVIAHPGWGETLFIKRVWPGTKLATYCEYYYQEEGTDYRFDPEFAVEDDSDVCRLYLKNLNNDFLMNDVDAAISPTKWQADTYPKYFRNKIEVIHDGVDTEIVAPNENIQIKIAKQITLTKDSEIITFVTRNLEPTRGFHIFARALPKILAKNSNVNILIVGDTKPGYGPLPDEGGNWRDKFVAEVRQQITDSDWARVHFLGHVEYKDYLAILQISSVHVYLTYPFVLSWSLLEAMSVGCAVIASDTKPLLEVIKHNETGRLVSFFDPQVLAKEVCELLENPSERKRLGTNARQFVQENYDLKKVCLPAQLDWVSKLSIIKQIK